MGTCGGPVWGPRGDEEVDVSYRGGLRVGLERVDGARSLPRRGPVLRGGLEAPLDRGVGVGRLLVDASCARIRSACAFSSRRLFSSLEMRVKPSTACFIFFGGPPCTAISSVGFGEWYASTCLKALNWPCVWPDAPNFLFGHRSSLHHS